jgi:septal ring factor EnvC (AmiA/AmiB activator)
MAEASERLLLLEQHVQRAIALIEDLRAENARLSQDRAGLAERVEALTAEVGALRQREQSLGRLEGEHRRLLEERRQLLGQIEGMLKELARIEGP